MILALVVFVEQGQRRIPVQYAKRMVGRRMYGGTSTYIPLKVNMAGIIPVIFASSLLFLPTLLVQLTGSQAEWAQWIATNFSTGTTTWYLLVFFTLCQTQLPQPPHSLIRAAMAYYNSYANYYYFSHCHYYYYD